MKFFLVCRRMCRNLPVSRMFLACLALSPGLTLGVAGAGLARAAETPANDYPTEARADYVFGCMAVNGQTREVLRKCACSIDVIASILPYSEYEAAETVMSVVQKGGEQVAVFRSYGPLREKVNNLKRAQVEGDLRCF